MHTFSYKAIDSSGKVHRGSLDANHLADLEARLRVQQLDLIDGKEYRSRLLVGSKKIQRKDVINFCVYLEQLVSAGVPLLDALKDLRDSLQRDAFQAIVASLVEKIEGGEKFSQALDHFPKVFGESFVNMIVAGEESGRIEQVLVDLAESIKWQDELAAQAKKALTYPAITAAVVTAVVFFLMTYLVPQLVEFIQSMDGELPFYTVALISVSDFFVANWLFMLSAPIVIGAIATYAIKHFPRARFFADYQKLNVPVVGPILQKILLARFSHYLSMLYASGITVLRSLEICERLVANKVIEHEIEDIRYQIISGRKIHEAMMDSRMFQNLTARMVRVGEQTGSLEKSLANVAYFYKREVDEAIDKLRTLIEPMLTGVMGLIIAWIMLAVLGPMYNLMTTLDI